MDLKLTSVLDQATALPRLAVARIGPPVSLKATIRRFHFRVTGRE